AITSVPPAPPPASHPSAVSPSRTGPGEPVGPSWSLAPAHRVRATVSPVTRWIHDTTLSARTYTPPLPHGRSVSASPRDTTPISAGPAGVSRYTGPPESPKQASGPSPPAVNSPPGDTRGLHA